MRRPLFLLLTAVMASLAIAALSSVITKNICARQLVPPGDDLAWFRREFRLSDAELQHIRQLHEGYLPTCRKICAQIAEKKQELHSALADGQGITPLAEQKLAEVAALRVECQAQMLRHFHEVSLAMPPEQGRRYLEEMQRLTLGFHEQIEGSMAPAPLPHGHH